MYTLIEYCSTGEGPCVWSDQEWSMITGADKATTDTPSWLKVYSCHALDILPNLSPTPWRFTLKTPLRNNYDDYSRKAKLLGLATIKTFHASVLTSNILVLARDFQLT